MDAADKRMLEREALRNMIQQWNANRLDLFALSEPNENLEFHGVMRFYFQDSGQKIATKCIRVASDATVSDVIETLIEKFRPDMRMLSLGSYSLWETHGPDDERKLEPHEKPLLVQLNWHADDREGRFLLKCLSNNEVPLSAVNDKGDQNFKRKLSKREKKELKKKEKLSRLKSDTNDENRPVAEKLYTELPETSFMRSISNPEAVMRRRRQQKLGRKLQQFKSKDGGPDTGGTLRVYGSILRPDVSYVTLLLSVNDSAATVLRETLDKYGMSYQDPSQFCIVQEDKTDNSEYILEDDECPLALMNMTRSSIMFHVRRRPADVQPRRRKKKVGSGTGTAGGRPGNDPMLVEMSPDATVLENGRRLRITDVVEVGSGNGTTLQLYGPSIQPRHCVVAPAEGGGYNVTPLHADAHVYVNGRRIMHSQRLQHGCLLKFGRVSTFRFVDPAQENLINRNLAQSQHFGSGSIYDRMSAGMSSGRGCQEAILPAVLEFPEAGQAQFLAAVITRLDPHAPAFKLAPVYTLYLCARYRASTHYRPELTPTERAHKLTAFLHHVATLIHATVQERCADSAAQAFWMTNASELLHFLKYDRHISSFSTQAQEVLSLTVQNAFSNLVTCFQEELSRGLATLTSAAVGDANEATAPTLQALAAAIVLLRRCRVNAALTIQLFSHLFHYINAVCFNKLVTEPGMVSARWGAALSARLKVLAAWAERQGLELAAECHFARMNQAARLIQGEYRTADEAVAALKACFKLNSVQTRALLTPLAPPDVVEAGVAYVRTHTDELYRADGRDIRLEESSWLGAGLLIPSDGFSAEVVCGVPPGLAEFVAPLQRGGLCRLAHQPHALGVWTVYMCGHAPASAARRAPDPRVHIIQLHKNSNGMGLSIVAAKGAGQTKLGIYIKSVVPGGAAAADGRLAAGDQLLSVDGQSLVGITQEKAAEYLVRTGPTVTLEVAKQGALLHGLATLLHQPAYNQRQVEEVQYEDRSRRNSGTFTNPHPALLRPASPRTELATAGYGRRPCHNRCHFLKDESTESSTDESEEWQPHYHGSIPRLIVTLDRENNQLQDDLSPDTPGCPLELRADAPPPRPIPVFTFTCEDFDEQQPSGDSTTGTQAEESPQHPPRFDTPPEEPPPVPDPPANYDQSSDNGDSICLPPQMEPIDTKLTLDLFNARSRENEFYRRRCTGIDECVSACECCRTPQPETQQIPYIDEPNSEPLIFENEGPPNKVATPKIRRILPSLSLDQSDSEKKPETADAVCQTPSSPMEVKSLISTPKRKLELNLDIKKDYDQMDNIQCRLKRAIFSMSTSYSGKSEDTEIPSTYSTSDSFDETTNEVKCDVGTVKAQTPAEPGAKQILDSVDRKSWKSPDEYRPSFGKVKELTKHFNDINLKYCVKIYKRNCQSSPNLSVRDKTTKVIENLPASASLADIQYEFNKTDTSETKCEKLSDDEVKSILIQLEDWSKYGSRGSEDTLAHGNEFEIPNLPSEEHTDNTANGYVFNEIIDKKPRRITLDNIRLKSNQSSMNSDQTKQSKESVIVSEASSEKGSSNHLPRVVAMIPQSQSSLAASCPDISAAHTSSGAAGAGVAGGGVRRASERDLPARLAAEASVKSSKSTPALHHAPPEPAPAHHHTPVSVAVSPAAASVSPSAWPSKSRSSHNLSAPTQHDGFYQNLSTVQSQQHALQDRWSSLRSSTGSNRPQSAHFMAGGQAEAPDSPLHHQNVASARAAKLAEMSEEVSRRQMAYHAAQQQHAQQHAQQPQHGQPQHHHLIGQPQLQMSGGGYGPQSPHPLHQSQPMLHVHNQSPHQIYHNQHHPPQRYEWMPPGPPSPQRSQPPVAPKPQGARRTDMEMEEQLHQHAQSQHPQSQHAQSQHPQSQHAQSQHPQSQHPQSQHPQSHLQQQQPPLNSVQPEDERYVASALEPPAVSVYPAGGGAAGAGRGAAPHNPWQREERERQHEARRAQARARRDATIAQLLSLGAARTPVQNQQLRALQLERDFELRATQHDQEEGNAAEGSEEPEEMQDELPSSPPAASPAPPLTAAPPPKSILKTNTRTTEITNGYTTEQVTYEETRVSEVSSAVSALSVSSSTHTVVGGAASVAGPGAPPPPLRGSSFAVMAERARTLSPPRHDQHAHAQHNAISVAPQSPVGSARDKRVSFHERAAPPAPPASSPPPLHEPPQPAREDPDRFIEEAESMLAGPVSPQTNNAPNMPQHTPGVIGAQEVYRDPRARRLAEQQARAPSAPVPEQLSFKEKMKMFALESGEASTPKDKVKISRAQRDIDAVH